jgi:Rrf2 family protein
MRLSTRSRYGLRAMVELALNYNKQLVMLKIIAKRQELSVRYLENIMTTMVAGGLVNSTRGKKGGFSLARDPEKIKASEVVQLLEGSLAPVACVDNPALCKKNETCVTRDIWKKMKQSMVSVLDDITLKDMAELNIRKQSAKGPDMYFI